MPVPMPSSRALRLLLASLMAIPIGTECGCNFTAPFRRGERVSSTALPAQMTAAELVAHLNENTSRVRAWRSTDVKIKTRGPLGLPIGIGATMAVESPKNFRLVASSVRGSEADIGSNADRFWMWVRPSDLQRVLTVKHEHIPILKQQMQMPIEPEWLMQACGVVPLDPTGITIDPTSVGSSHYLLVSNVPCTHPQAQPMRRVIEVDRATGLVTRQRLMDIRGQMIAEAKMSDHRTDPESGATLPRKIELNWPQAKMGMSLAIRDLEINPPHLGTSLWQLPTIASAPPLDLSRRLAQMPRGSQPIQTAGAVVPADSAAEPLPPLGRKRRDEPEAAGVVEFSSPGAVAEPDPFGQTTNSDEAPPFPDF